MVKVTRDQAVAATFIGAGLALSTLLYKQQAARIASLAIGALLPTALWSLYFGRGMERHLDTDEGRKWLVQNGTYEQLETRSLESLKACHASQGFDKSELCQLAGCEDEEIAQWACAETCKRDGDEAFAAIKRFFKKHQALPEVDAKYIENHLNNSKEFRQTFAQSIVKRLKVTDLTSIEYAVLERTKLPDVAKLTSLSRRVSKQAGFEPIAIWAMKQLMTRDDLKGNERMTALRLFLRLKKEELSEGLIEQRKDQHKEAIQRMSLFLNNHPRTKGSPTWPLTLLPEETIGLIEQFCERQLSKLAGHKDEEIAQWACTETCQRDGDEAFAAIEKFFQKHRVLPKVYDQYIQNHLNKAEEFRQVLAKPIVARLDDSTVTDLTPTEYSLLEGAKLPNAIELKGLCGRVSEQAGLEPIAIWALEQLMTRDDLEGERQEGLCSFLYLEDWRVSKELLQQNKGQHQEVIERMSPFLTNHPSMKTFPTWPLTLLPEKTIGLIEQFCERQRQSFLPKDFEPGVTVISQDVFNELVNYKLIDQQDLVKMAGYRPQVSYRRIEETQACWAIEELLKDPNLTVDTLTESMNNLVAKRGYWGSGRVAASAICSFLQREGVSLESQQVQQLVLTPYLKLAKEYRQTLLDSLGKTKREEVKQLLDWAFIKMFETKQVNIEMLIALMEDFVTDKKDPEAWKVANQAIENFFKRIIQNWDAPSIEKLVLMPFQLKLGNFYAMEQREREKEELTKIIEVGLSTYWENTFEKVPGGYELHSKKEFDLLESKELLTNERLIAMCSPPNYTEASKSSGCWALEKLFMRQDTPLEQLATGMEKLLNSNRITEGKPAFLGRTVAHFLGTHENLNIEEKKLKKLILLPTTKEGIKEEYTKALLDGLGEEARAKVEILLS